MTGRIWRFTVDDARRAAFERYAAETALPLVQARMGCSAVFALRAAEPGRYAWATFWVSRKAMAMTLASPEWNSVAGEFERFGVRLEAECAEHFDCLSAFIAGEKPEAPSA